MRIQWIIPNSYNREDHVLLEVNPRALRPRPWEPSRFRNLLKRLPEGGEIDAPYVYRNSKEGIKIGDGIHRSSVAIWLNMGRIGIQVPKEDAGLVQQICQERAKFWQNLRHHAELYKNLADFYRKVESEQVRR